MTNETRNLQSLEKTIRAKLFSIQNIHKKSDNPILFSNDLQPNGLQPIIHSPLQQLSEFYHRWGSLLPPNMEERVMETSHQPENVVQRIDNCTVIPELIGSPVDLFNSLEFEKIGNQYNNIVKEAKKVKLLGAISLPSVYDVIIWLKNKGFSGVLEVYDVSSIPLKIGQLYQQLGLLPVGIQVNFINKSALEIQKDEQTDLIISDVLGYYLTHKEYSRLATAITDNLRSDGVWLTRELIEPNGEAPLDKKTVSRNHAEKLGSFNDFIEKQFGFKLDPEILEEWENTRWSKSPQYPRKSKEEYLADFPKTLTLESDIQVSSTPLWNSENRRIFETMIFKKKRK
jgi:hypothetical protein